MRKVRLNPYITDVPSVLHFSLTAVASLFDQSRIGITIKT